MTELWQAIKSRWVWILFGTLIVLLLCCTVAMTCTILTDKRQLRQAALDRANQNADGWFARLSREATSVLMGGIRSPAHVRRSSDFPPPTLVTRMPDEIVTATAPHSRYNRFLLVRNYNDDGGFFWQMYNILCAAQLAYQNHLGLVVLLDSGLYLERNPFFLAKYGKIVSRNNWFHSYFEALYERRDSRIEQLIQARSPRIFSAPALVVQHGRAINLRNDDSLQIVEFTRQTFDQRVSHFDFAARWRETFCLLPQMQEKLDCFWSKHMASAQRLIGIHFRGSDKYASADDSEDSPVHYEYEWCGHMVQQQLDRLKKYAPGASCAILVCSDEQPFIEYMNNRFSQSKNHENCNTRLVYTSSIRSNINTGGLHLDSQSCRDENDMRDTCVSYRALKHHSVHRGMTDQSAYQKGEDVLLDVLLLSRCHVFLRSRGNVSNFPGYINPSLEVIDMANEYRAMR